MLDPNYKNGRKQLHFQSMWVDLPECKNIINATWKANQRGSPPFKMCKKLKRVKHRLSTWNKTSLGNIHMRIRETREVLADCQKKAPLDVNNERNLKSDLQFLLVLEEKLWCDQSREAKIICNGTNSRFFHISTITCRNRTKINRIKQN